MRMAGEAKVERKHCEIRLPSARCSNAWRKSRTRSLPMQTQAVLAEGRLRACVLERGGATE
jgi:hypothetical protein